jgi:hypothetical protein
LHYADLRLDNSEDARLATGRSPRNLLHGLFAAMHRPPTLLARADEVIE